MFLVLVLAITVILYLCFRGTPSERNIKTLVKKTSRWATMAQQDDSPVTAMLHANMASGYLAALRDIATPKEIQRAAHIDFDVFEERVLGVQNLVTKKVTDKCPELLGQVDLYLNQLAEGPDP
jgi:hypothetical protein